MNYLVSVCNTAVFLLMLYVFPLNAAAQLGTDSLLRELKLPIEDSSRVGVYNKLARRYYPDRPDSAYIFAKKALDLAMEINFPEGISNAYRSLGVSYMAEFNYEQALKYFYIGLQYAEKENLTIEIAKFYILVSIVEKTQKNYEKSLEFSRQALKIYQQNKNKTDLVSLYNTMGESYFAMKKYYQALEHFEMAYEQSKHRSDKLGIDVILFNIGSCYYELENYEKALIYLTEVQEMQKNGEYSKVVFGGVLNTIGAIYMQSDDYDAAESYFNKSMIIALKFKDLSLEIQIYQNLIELAYKRQEVQAIYQNHKTYKLLSDSLHLLDQKQKVTELGIKYQTQIKEHEIAQLSQEQMNQRYITLGIFLILILSLVILFLMIRHFKSRNELAESIIERYRIEQEKLKKEIEAKFKEKESVKSQLDAAKHEHDKLVIILKNTSAEKEEIIKELEENNAQIVELENKLDTRNEEYESEQLFYSLKSQLDMVIQNKDGGKATKAELRRMRELIGNLIVEHKNKDFFRRLKEAFPKLSNEDLRMCAFMRNHFSNAEIADFLEITQETLYTRKHRLKRKLDLDKDVDVTEFLLDFDDVQEI